MKLLLSVIGVAAVIGMCASADAAVIISRDDGAALPAANSEILGNLSYLFGWQMAGAMATTPDLSAAACSDLSSIGNGKWAAMGLDSAFIQEPLCNSSDSAQNSNAQQYINQIIPYSTEIFLNQLLGSFNDDAIQYICGTVDFYLLNLFWLDSTAIIGKVCHSVGEPLRPQPFGPEHSIGDARIAAAAAATNSVTVLYSLLRAAGAASDIELSDLCTDAAGLKASFNAQLMNGTVYEETVCAIMEPVSVDEAVELIFTWTTRIFIIIMENISNVGGWLDWLCKHVDTDGMNSMDLDGRAVETTVCFDSTAADTF